MVVHIYNPSTQITSLRTAWAAKKDCLQKGGREGERMEGRKEGKGGGKESATDSKFSLCFRNINLNG
jgi:hypothetical protein